MNTLTLEVKDAEYEAVVVVRIDGVLLLDLAVRRPGGQATVSHNFTSATGNLLLPPDTYDWIPSAAARDVVVAVCSCGQPQDEALWVSVDRLGPVVTWGPALERLDRPTIDSTFSFDLVQYLDAVDRASSQLLRADSRAGRMARRLRGMQRRVGGLTVGSDTGKRVQVLNATATDHDEVVVDLAPLVGHLLKLDERADEQIVQELLERGSDLPQWTGT